MDNNLKPAAKAIIEFLETTDKDAAKYIQQIMNNYTDNSKQSADFKRNMDGVANLVRHMQSMRSWQAQTALNNLIN